MITSRIDELFYKNVEFDNPYIGSLIFSGDADASRSMLSAVSTGWATILGVAFSVTLITLQLSTSKYTSHLVNRFENDKINQLTLAWFVSVVLYSLLVLKTVRTGSGELSDDVFTPILGVNVSILLAGLALFIFVAFLHNIASYLRPNMLISGIVDQIIDSLKPFKKRKEYHIKGNKSLHIDNNKSIVEKAAIMYELRSNQKGICRSINWEKIYHLLDEFSKQNNESLWMQWYKTLGDLIEKNDVLAVIYSYDKSKHLIKCNNHNNHHYQDNDIQKTDNINNDTNKDYKNKSFNQDFISKVAISTDRVISNDPVYGLEIVQSLAVKSSNQSDTDIVGSCITGLFRILRHILRSSELLGIPFTLKDKSEVEVQSLTANNPTNPTDSHFTTLVVINPKETKLSDSILFKLSLILENSASNNQITVMKYFINEYIALSRFLLEVNRLDEFSRITNWCAEQLEIYIKPFQKQFQGQMIVDLIHFKKELIMTYPKMADIYENDMKVILTNELENYVNKSVGR